MRRVLRAVRTPADALQVSLPGSHEKHAPL
jgi:hypothetical protein